MKITGQVTLLALSLIYLIIEFIYYGEKALTFETVLPVLLALVVGWQYDSYRYYIKISRENEQSYRSLIDSLPESVFIHHNNEILYVNDAAVTMMHAKDRDELLGHDIFEFIDPEYYERTIERMRIAKSKGKALPNMEHKIFRMDGVPIFFEVSTMSISYGGKKCLLTIGKDITNRRVETERLLQKSDKLALLGQMAAGIAHEIRNPLTSIKGFVQLFKADNDKKEYYDIVLSELERINTIVSEFLVLAKPSAAVFREKEITGVLNDVVTLINTQSILNNVEIVTDFEPKMPTIICEENQLKQVFINLLKNSIEAMPDGGKIHISSRNVKDGEIMVKITDEGVGIPEERMETLGEPFYTTKEKGTGLGLMTCFKIIEGHNGKLIISSHVGEGTSIVILLPSLQ
ncbi:histidine kinase [Bacillus sp. FJAT-18017]|uniref:ATP-binding protein n=1 Tax=Bacillus sp. FJAT-18017 TaxID=1705566 RepID=UPI0006AEF7D8|nr:ATP-binding protein [Bacillus sp. FJAT-18017]ALC90439.1 histidine kinase [Bacillus sp. FJAT-18017]